jgi:GNAT superfamily N-acetyltransferase
MFSVRKLNPSDAPAFLDFLNITDSETDFMMQEPGERQMNAFQLSMSVSTGYNHIFIAVENEKIIGYLIAFYMYGRGSRTRHSLHIGIAVLQTEWGKGIGTALFEEMERWAKSPAFQDGDCSFAGPLESAASLGIMKTFRIYKPSMADAGFFEIQHLHNRYLGQALKTS